MKRRFTFILLGFGLLSFARPQVPDSHPDLYHTHIRQSHIPHSTIPASLIFNWDTIYAYDSQNLFKRFIQQCNTFGKPTTQLTQSRNGSAWVNGSRETYTYDAGGHQKTWLSEVWNVSAWVNDMRRTDSCDASGNPVSVHYEHWWSNGWVNASLITNIYSPAGNLMSSLWQNWINNGWGNAWRYTYAYDGNGNVITALSEQWSANAWLNDWNDTYTYNTDGTLASVLTERWNGAWVNWSLDTYAYDGALLTITNQVWTGAWQNYYRFTYSHDTEGNLITSLNQAWLSGVWTDQTRQSFSYNADGNSVSGKTEEYLTYTSTWVPGSDILPVYSQKELIYSIGEQIYRYEAVFSSYITGLNRQSDISPGLTIYPNPAQESISVKLPPSIRSMPLDATIYTINGKPAMKEQVVMPSGRINVSKLAPALYILQLVGNGVLQSATFHKQ